MKGVPVLVESKRGCGYRKPGGLYLRCSAQQMRDCGRLPAKVGTCAYCEKKGLTCELKPSRGWTWLDAGAFFSDIPCKAKPEHCDGCPLQDPEDLGRCGLIWIGEAYYSLPKLWTNEAKVMGVSRRISRLPRGFKLGETWVLVAHVRAIEKLCPSCKGLGCSRCKKTGRLYEPGIFHAFRPSAVEFVVKGDESEAEIEAMRKRGITPVEVRRDRSEENQGVLL